MISVSGFPVGATLVDSVQILAIEEQKKNVVEAHRKEQHDRRVQASNASFTGMITPPVIAPVQFNFQLPSPPSSPPDEERKELTNYLQQFAQGILLIIAVAPASPCSDTIGFVSCCSC